MQRGKNKVMGKPHKYNRNVSAVVVSDKDEHGEYTIEITWKESRGFFGFTTVECRARLKGGSRCTFFHYTDDESCADTCVNLRCTEAVSRYERQMRK